MPSAAKNGADAAADEKKAAAKSGADAAKDKKKDAAKKTTKTAKKKTVKKAAEKKADEKKAPAKKAAKKTTKKVPQLRVRQVKSGIKHPHRMRRTLTALGLKHHQDEVVVPDNPSIRGMLRRVHHLVSVTPEE